METYESLWEYKEAYGNIRKHREILESTLKLRKANGNIWKHV